MSDDVFLVDSKGRKLTLGKLSILDQVKILRAIGAEQSGNEQYVNLVYMAARITEIDGVPQPRPSSERMIDAMISRLDDAGFIAIQTYIKKEIDELYAMAEAVPDGEAKPTDPLEKSA